LKRLPTRDLSRPVRRASIAGLAAVVVLCLQASPQAARLQCSGPDAQRLKEAEATYFNLFHFDVFDDLDRCRSLQMSLEYQLRLTAWIERCDPDQLPNARARLNHLSDLADDETHCRG
jgi:hypothetical protein